MGRVQQAAFHALDAEPAFNMLRLVNSYASIRDGEAISAVRALMETGWRRPTAIMSVWQGRTNGPSLWPAGPSARPTGTTGSGSSACFYASQQLIGLTSRKPFVIG